MLEVSYGEWNTEGSTDYQALSLEDLCALVDRFAAAPPLSSYGPNASGDHAWMSVIDRGFVAHVYFDEGTGANGTVEFELYGPYPPGTERDYSDPYDGNGLAGRMTTECLKQMLSILDAGKSPIDFVRTSAISAS